MIGKVDKSAYFKKIIEYHESKIMEGVAKLVYNDTLEETTSGKIRNFTAISELNEKVSKNKCAHFSFSFVPGESVVDNAALNAIFEIMKNLGYNDNQMLIYRHFDKKHQHYHVVTPTIKLSGSKVNDYKDHEELIKLCRFAEKKYGFQVPEKTNQYDASLGTSVLHMNEYSISKALSKINRDPLLGKINTILSSSSVTIKSLSKNQTNQEIINRVGERTFQKLTNELNRNKLIKSPKLLKLRNLLLDTLKISKTNYEFLDNCKKLDIYYRPLIKDGKKYFVFGHDGFYAKDYKISKNITYEKLFNTKDFQNINGARVFDKKEQQAFLKRNIKRAASLSTTLEEFNVQLAARNIDPIYVSNARGVYGISFKSNQVQDPVIFKGSELGMSYTKLSNLLHENHKNLQLIKFEGDYKKDISFNSVIATKNNSGIKSLSSIRPSPAVRSLSHLISGSDKELNKLSRRLKGEDNDKEKEQ